MAQRRGIRILTFDGENTTCSGVSSALETLQEIMHRVSWSESEEEDDKSTSSSNGSISLARPCDYFDLIVGSGDGAWIAAMLGRLGLSVSQAIDEYQRIHPSIHHSQPPLSIEEKGIQLELKLKDLVQAHSEDPKALLQASRSKLKCQVALLAMTPSNMAFPCVFRSYRAREHPLKNCAIWEAICAATAVTGVLPPYKIGGKTYIAASEARHCNPIETALQEAKVAFPHAEPSCVISLGAGHPGHVSLQGSDVTSVAAATLELVRDAEQASHNVQPRLNLQEQPQVYFRFNVEQGMQHYTQSSGPGYGDAHAHTTSYCKRQKVNLEINQVVDLLRDYQECLPSSVPSTALPEAKSIIHLHHSSEEPIQTYIDELYNLKRGLPLWDPQPRSKVVEIGDVGIIDDDGSFEIFFNATVEPDNQPKFRVPPGFVPYRFNPDNVKILEGAIRPDQPCLHHGAMSIKSFGLKDSLNTIGISSMIKKKTRTQNYELSFDILRGAALVVKDLDNPPASLSLPPSTSLREYILKHYATWYKFCRDPKGLDRDLGRHQLIFITGVTRGADWTLGAWPDLGTRRRLSYAGQATFHGGQLSKLSGTWAPTITHEILDGPVRERPGPPNPALHGGIRAKIGDQCFFIKGYKLGLRNDIRAFPETSAPLVPEANESSWRAAVKALKLGIPLSIKGAAEPKDLPPPPPPPFADPIAARDDTSIPDLLLEELHLSKPLRHPLDDLLDLAFQTLPNCKAAIVHDEDLSLLQQLQLNEKSVQFTHSFEQVGECGIFNISLPNLEEGAARTSSKAGLSISKNEYSPTPQTRFPEVPLHSTKSDIFSKDVLADFTYSHLPNLQTWDKEEDEVTDEPHMANTTKQEQAPRMSLELASLAISSYGRDEEIYPASQGKESTANMLYPSIDQIQTLKRDTTEIQRDTQLENGEEDNEEEEDVGTDAFKSSAIPTAPEGIQGYPFNASREVYHFYTRGGRSHDQPPYNNLPSHSSPEERYLFDTSYGVRSAMTHGRTDGQSHGQSPFNTSLQPQTRREHQVQAHSTGNVKDPWPSYNASTQSRNYLGDSTSSTQPFSASQLSHLYQRSARGSFVRSPAPSDTDAGYSFSGSSSSSEYQTTHWSDVPNRHQFSSPSSSLAAPPLAHSDEDDMQSSSLVAQSESGFSASGSSPSSGYQRHQVASWAYPSPPRAPSPTFSDGDHAQSSSSDEHGPSLSSSPADYSTTTFISSPYETVSWPPGEATLATRSVQEAARRRRKRPPRFRCEFCPTDFTAKHNFENHMNSHRNIRPHKCKMGCGKSFGTAQVLRRHESKCKGLSSL